MARVQTALLLSALTLAVVPPAAAQTPPPPPPPYVVLGAGDKGAMARAIMIPDANNNIPQCPRIEVDGSPREMTERAKPDGGPFNIRVCEFALGSAKKAKIGEDVLPLPKDQVNSIAVFGDTGCRLKAGKDADEEDEMDEAAAAVEKANEGKYQDCKTDWPFQTMSETIAKAEPNLVIHVGDYYYRENPCDDHPGCHGSPYGDKWDTWAADFFTPAAALLKKAPWIVTRGNHETCKRGGLGYALLLDPTPVNSGSPPTCPRSGPPLRYDQYTVKVGGRSFIMLDSSDAPDECKKSCDSDWYYQQFRAMGRPQTGTWLITHKPIWGFTYSKNKKTHKRELGIRNMTLQAALDKKEFKHLPPAEIDLVLSGHIHLWEALSFKDKRGKNERSPQFVLGSGGTELAHKLPDRQKWPKIDGRRIKAIGSDSTFGYTWFEPSVEPLEQGRHWNATFYNPTGGRILACKVEPTKVACSNEP
jgi:hypothetical protein